MPPGGTATSTRGGRILIVGLTGMVSATRQRPPLDACCVKSISRLAVWQLYSVMAHLLWLSCLNVIAWQCTHGAPLHVGFQVVVEDKK